MFLLLLGLKRERTTYLLINFRVCLVRNSKIMWRRYLLWFAQEHVDFRHAEMQSILSLLNIPINYIEKPCVSKPYWIVELPSQDCAKQIASRSVSLRNCIELWARAKTDTQLHKNLLDAINNSTGKWITRDNSGLSDLHVCPRELIDECCSALTSFKVDVETYCKHFNMKQKVEKIEKFEYLPLKGPIRLKNPDVVLSYVEFYGMDPNDVPEKPYDLFFGKWVADGQRELIQRHTLKRRQFIGNTSMDAQLSLLMANQAQVRNGDVILDPFVGSGSLFVAAAHFGAYVWGSDIDFMMLHGRTRPTRVGQKVREEEESIRSNMKNYGTDSRYLDVVVSDFSLPLWRENFKFDAIITDPPYGVREPAEKIGIDRDNYTLSPEQLVQHVPAKVPYGLPHVYGDLLRFAASCLVLRGRLVCWYPLVREEYTDSQLPTHPCLSLVANSEQVLSRLTSRRLLTYEKLAEPSPDTAGSNGGAHNFREKYFSLGQGQMTRKEIKKKRQEELASYIACRQQARIDFT